MPAIREPETFRLDVSEWVIGGPMTIESLRGRVVVVEAFQMLCPGCVAHGLPLAQRIRRAFDPGEVVVLGLHTVFEHHSVMGRDALEVFLAEYRIDLPVAIDRSVEGQALPATMQRYALPGTPSTLLIGRDGRLREIFFGAADDLAVGATLGRLLAELTVTAEATPRAVPAGALPAAACGIDGTCS